MALSTPSAGVYTDVASAGALGGGAAGFDPRVYGDMLAGHEADRAPGADLDPCQTWPDLLGNYPATQNTLAKRPTKRLVNDRWWLDFDVTDDGMLTALDLVAPYSIVLVDWPQASTGAMRTVQSSQNLIMSAGRTTQNAFLFGTAVSNYSTGASGVHVSMLVVTATGSNYYVDNIDRSLVTNITNAWPDVSFGAVGWSAIGVAATRLRRAYFYGNALTTANRNALYSALKTLDGAV